MEGERGGCGMGGRMVTGKSSNDCFERRWVSGCTKTYWILVRDPVTGMIVVRFGHADLSIFEGFGST